MGTRQGACSDPEPGLPGPCSGPRSGCRERTGPRHGHRAGGLPCGGTGVCLRPGCCRRPRLTDHGLTRRSPLGREWGTVHGCSEPSHGCRRGSLCRLISPEGRAGELAGPHRPLREALTDSWRPHPNSLSISGTFRLPPPLPTCPRLEAPGITIQGNLPPEVHPNPQPLQALLPGKGHVHRSLD